MGAVLHCTYCGCELAGSKPVCPAGRLAKGRYDEQTSRERLAERPRLA